MIKVIDRVFDGGVFRIVRTGAVSRSRRIAERNCRPNRERSGVLYYALNINLAHSIVGGFGVSTALAGFGGYFSR